MKNIENQSQDKLTLGKYEIIRGHNAYQRVLQNSASFSVNYFKAFVSIQFRKSSDDIEVSPLLKSIVKVGFIIAKKKIRKATLRNRARRIIKESYRLNKNLFLRLELNFSLIITLSELGYELIRNSRNIKSSFFNDDMISLSRQISKRYCKA